MSSEDRFDSGDTESPNTTPRGESHSFTRKKIPGLGGRPSPFYINTRKEYAQIATETGRSVVSSQNELSEVRHLYERSGTMEGRREEFEFAPETEQWSATHRKQDGIVKEKDDFTFRENDDVPDVVVSASKVIKTEGEKTGGEKKVKKGGKKKKQGDGISEDEKPREGDVTKKKKKKKDIESDKVPRKKDSEDLSLNDIEGQEDVGASKKKVKKAKKKTGESSEDEKKSDSGDSSYSMKRKRKDMNLRQLMAIRQQSFNMSEQNEIQHDTRGFILTDSVSFVSSPQSMLALTKEPSKGEAETKTEFCHSPRLESEKMEKKEKAKKKEKKIKDEKRKKYEIEIEVEGEEKKKAKAKKLKERKHKHHHKHEHEQENDQDQSKKILFTDGLNLVKLLPDRTNCKKTKLFIILYTLSILWSIVLNSLELVIFKDTDCRAFTENGLNYFSFALMVVLKFLSISLFNLELVFKQPYKSPTVLLYPFMIQCFSTLLQLPQNVYDFNACQRANNVFKVSRSWKVLQALLGSMGGIALYMIAKKKTDISTVKSRLGGCLNRIVKCAIVLLVLAWNIILFVAFGAQKNVFLPNFFFDFYLYIVLGVGVALLLRAKRRLGKEKFRAIFIKEEKKLIETPRQPVSARGIVKIEVQQ